MKEPKYKSVEERKKEKLKELIEIQSLLVGNGNLNEYFKTKILSSLKNRNKVEDPNNEKNQIKEKDPQSSDYEVFKKLFKYFRDENVFYSFDKKEKYNRNLEQNIEEEKDKNEKKSFENFNNNNDEEEEENEENNIKSN